MIEIPEPPTIHACATCPAILSWLYSAKSRAWICVVPVDTVTFRLHECRHAQAPGTWKQIRQPDPPSVEYLAAREAIKTRTDGSETT